MPSTRLEKIAFRAKSPRLSHGDRRKALAVTTPEFVLYGKNGQQWHATSRTAWIATVGKRIDLERDVHVERRDIKLATSFELTTESRRLHGNAEDRGAGLGTSVLVLTM